MASADVNLGSDADAQHGSTARFEPLQTPSAQRLSWLERLLPLPSLPAYTGPHAVGTLDLEVPVREPRTIGGLQRLDGSDALRVDTLRCILFYPTDSTARGRRMSWLGTTKAATAAGYAKFASVSKWLVLPIALLFAGFIRLPAYLNAPLLRKDKGRRRLIVFSHGLAGYRTVYSQYCGELASRGYVVATLEHRDGSGPSSFVSYADGRPARYVPFYRAEDISEATRLPPLKMREKEVAMRVEEVAEALRFLRELNADGATPTLCEGLAQTRAADVDWATWRDSMETTCDVVLAGHSFGGATAIHATRALPRELLDVVSHAVLLDPWCEPLPSTAGRTTLPVIAINSPGFTHWKQHFPVLERIVTKAGKGSILARLGGSVHTNFSDFPVLLPRVMRLRRRKSPKVDPRHAIDICALAMAAFVEREPERSPLSSNRGAVPGDAGDALDEPGKVYIHATT